MTHYWPKTQSLWKLEGWAQPGEIGEMDTVWKWGTLGRGQNEFAGGEKKGNNEKYRWKRAVMTGGKDEGGSETFNSTKKKWARSEGWGGESRLEDQASRNWTMVGG